MGQLLAPRAEASTSQVPPDQRLAFWESHNASTLIGLTCTTHDPGGLVARERNWDLGDVRITDISGNQHVIERPRHMLRTHPKDSVFACILLKGEAFFFQQGECVTLNAGDVIAYSTDMPYLYGFTGEMRQLIVEADFSLLATAGVEVRPRSVIKLDNQLRTGRLLATALRTTAHDFVKCPDSGSAPEVAARARSLLQALVTPEDSRQALTDTACWRLLHAEMFIAERLADPTLDATMVARAIGISVRHLNRLFTSHGCTVNQWIWSQRLDRAREQLMCPTQRRVGIGDIAFRLGFATQAHFSRVFKARFGVNPSALRSAMH